MIWKRRKIDMRFGRWGNPQERDHLRNMSIDGRIIV
jgi:hypothetical protein